MTRTPWARLVVGLLALCAVTLGLLPRPAASPTAQVYTVPVPGAHAGFAYCSTHPVDGIPTHVTRVVVAVHGLGGDACGWRATVADALRADRGDTLVIAPQFGPSALPEVLGWTNQDWPAGKDAARDGPSSYTALDALLARLAGRQVVLVGFSGGGQLVNRYAATSPVAVSRYVVMNPSSYLYFTPDRPGAAASDLAACPTYDDWRYGLRKRVDYAAMLTELDIAQRYAARHVTYLIGSRDDFVMPSLDRSCGALAQGPDRETRAERYHEHLRTVFGDEVATRQPLRVVPGVGHDGVAMVRSDAARAALLGEDDG